MKTKRKRKTDRRVVVAMRLLRKLGYFAKWKFWCCQGCGIASLPEGTTKYAFAHKQDTQSWRKNGFACLTWGGDGQEIFNVLAEAGLFPKWNGEGNTRIMIRKNINVKDDA